VKPKASIHFFTFHVSRFTFHVSRFIPMRDLIIKNAHICDGSGKPGFQGSIAVRDGKIAEVGSVNDLARRILDVKGLTVSPGFIDPHTHYDAQFTWDPMATPTSWHGITTVVIGNCGFTIAPCRPQDREMIMRTLEKVEGMSLEAMQKGIRWNFVTIPEYLNALEKQGVGLNVVSLMGHSSIRQYIIGPEASEREAKPTELEAMKQVVREAMEAGSFGIGTSTGTTHIGGDGKPVSSRLANTNEFIELSHVIGSYKRGIIEVTPALYSPLKLWAQMAKESGRPVTWAVLLQQPAQPDYHRQVLKETEAFFRQGLELYPQVSCRPLVMSFAMDDPYVFEGLPCWQRVFKASPAERSDVLKNPDFRAAFRHDTTTFPSRLFAGDWETIQIQKVSQDKHRSLVGKNLLELGQKMGKHPSDVLFDLSLEENLGMEFFVRLMNTKEDAVAELLVHPHTLIAASDAGAHLTLFCDAGYTSYFLGHWIREKGIIPLEEGIRRLTSVPAQIYGIKDRGRIEVGKAADLTIFDPGTIHAESPERIRDLPGGGERLVSRSRGIHYTFVNGIPLMEEGRMVASDTNLAGKVLRCGR
jgi:N-acyl-D-aspartate/D-glutamate deacylase